MISVLASVLLFADPSAAAGLTLPEAMALLQSGPAHCQMLDDGVLDYVGPSDLPFDACLNQSSLGAIRKIVITSGGGDASETIAAAHRLLPLDVSLEVRGLCASSCANYLVPAAAELTVSPGSILALHGAAEPSETYRTAIQDEVERQQRTQYPDVSDQVVADGRSFVGRLVDQLVADQDDFAKAAQIGPDWFALSRFHTVGYRATPKAFAIPDAAFVAAQLPRLKLKSYWYPATDADVRGVAEQMAGAELCYATNCPQHTARDGVDGNQ